MQKRTTKMHNLNYDATTMLIIIIYYLNQTINITDIARM